MNEKKIEPTQAMVEEALFHRPITPDTTRAILRIALNHPEAPRLFADEDALRAAREQGWDEAVEALGKTGFSRLAPALRNANPYRPAQELPTEDGVEIVPAGGGPIGAAHPGGKFTTHHATYDSYLGSWVGVWRAASGRVTVSSVSPGDITPGTWKVEGE